MTLKVLGNKAKGIVFVISAPAGTGKTTLSRMLSSEFSCVCESISFTTRPIREGEIEGKDYFFISQKTFEEKKAKGEFLEFAEVFGYHYATSRIYVENLQNAGKHVLLVIDTQGAMQLKKEGYNAAFIFIMPPSLEALKERLLKRKTETEANIEKRLSWAKTEISHRGHYDYLVINDNLANTYEVLRSILIAEEHKN